MRSYSSGDEWLRACGTATDLACESLYLIGRGFESAGAHVMTFG